MRRVAAMYSVRWVSKFKFNGGKAQSDGRGDGGGLHIAVIIRTHNNGIDSPDPPQLVTTGEIGRHQVEGTGLRDLILDSRRMGRMRREEARKEEKRRDERDETRREKTILVVLCSSVDGSVVRLGVCTVTYNRILVYLLCCTCLSRVAVCQGLSLSLPLSLSLSLSLFSLLSHTHNYVESHRNSLAFHI